MIDQSHNLKDPIEDLVQSTEAILLAYAQALLVDGGVPGDRLPRRPHRRAGPRHRRHRPVTRAPIRVLVEDARRWLAIGAERLVM